MRKFSFRSLMEQAEAVAANHGLQVLEIVNESGRSRRVIIELCKGPEISVQTEICFHKGNTLDITYTWWLRWPRAEKMLNDLRPPSPHDMSEWNAEAVKEITEARSKLYPIAQLRLEHGGYFTPSPGERLAFTELDRIPLLLEKVLGISKRAVEERLHAYCDPNHLAVFALQPESETLLSMTPMAIGAVLVAAVKKEEFAAWKETYTSKVLRGQRNPPVMAHYIAGFERLLSQL